MRTLVASVAAAAALCLAAVPAGAAELRLSQTSGTTFPDRAFILSAPEGVSFKPADVQVRENGQVVTGLQVVSPDSGSVQFGTVLVIDASRSMQGRPIRAAMGAARAFAERRNPEHPLAVVLFNSRPTVLLPLTTDSERIERALSAPPALGRETRIYDATVAATRLLAEAKLAAGSVVVLSDGGDTGSRIGEFGTVRAARQSGARVFSVGLESGAFDRRTLERLAAQGGGRYTTASSPEQLEGIFSALGSQLASEYLLRYRSYAGPGRRVFVEARVRGIEGAAQLRYVSPRTAGSGSQFERETFWTSAIPVLLVSLLGALAFALLAIAVVGPRRRGLPAKLAGFVSVPEVEHARDTGSVARQLFAGAERSLDRSRWWGPFKEELEIAKIKMPAVQVLLWTAAGTVFVAWVFSGLTGTPVMGMFGLLVPIGVRTFILRRLKAQRMMFAEQLAENVQVMASALRAGHSLIGALSVMTDQAAEPAQGEFRRVVADERLGVPVERSLEVVAQRMQSRDVQQVAMVAQLQRETGGNTAEVLDQVADTVRGRFELRRLVQTLTAQGQLSRWVLTGLPIALLLVLTLVNRDYTSVLFDTTGGNVMLVLSAGLITTGSLVMKRIVDIKL